MKEEESLCDAPYFQEKSLDFFFYFVSLWCCLPRDTDRERRSKCTPGVVRENTAPPANACHTFISLTVTKENESYIYDPSVPVDGHGFKQDPSSNHLVAPYQCHRLPDDVNHKKQGFHNLGFTSNTSPTKLDIDNNHINRLHVTNQSRSNVPPATEGDSSLYILRPEGEGTPIKTTSVVPSAPPIISVPMLGTEPSKRTERFRDSGLGNGGMTDGYDGSDGYLCGQEEDEEDKRRQKTVGTSEYVGDTADEESVISVDIHTSSTSLSSADTKLVLEDTVEEDSSLSRREGATEKETDNISVTDSMVAEALAALEAATAGEEYE
ncbi:hypothetical protein NFI96_031534 [Prochilodus magdalenae]|nr:hypothetical protein NFI96_031534 [Prochilodus magdalenae]